jgi:hypothetical protein
VTSTVNTDAAVPPSPSETSARMTTFPESVDWVCQVYAPADVT